jgi:cation diffusion facilitator family transporter
MKTSTGAPPKRRDTPHTLTRFAWLSILAAVLTITLKALAYVLTGSVGLLSDALESVVNLVAAIAALIALTVAIRAPDEEHAYGHSKAEYFSSGLEGLLILIAAVSIVVTAIPRVLHPTGLNAVGLGIGVSIVASLINLGVAWQLFQAGKRYHSITLEANARHLLTDVWTSVGVLVAVAAVALTGWDRLDPIIALVVALNIVWTGVGLVRRSASGLMDAALPEDERATIQRILDRYEREEDIEFHGLRTRQAGAHRFMSVHVLVPGDWSVDRGHELLESIERDIRAAVPSITVFTHLESLDDPASWDDATLLRQSAEQDVEARA